MSQANASTEARINQVSGSTKSGASIEELLGISIDELFRRLGTSDSGLSSPEAENRPRTYGRNEIARRKKRAAIIEFLMTSEAH